MRQARVSVHRVKRGIVAGLVAALFAAFVAFSAPLAAGAATLTGTFELTPGSCSGGTFSGTYLRMILPSGSPSGPFMSNSDSSCHDQSVTPLAPGSDGGLVVGSYQSPPIAAVRRIRERAGAPHHCPGAVLRHRICDRHQCR